MNRVVPSAALATTALTPDSEPELARTLDAGGALDEAALAERVRARAEPGNAALLRCSKAVLERQMFGESVPVPIAGRDFTVLRRLGAGGMGVVYEVEQGAREGRMALKLLHRAGSEEAFRLKREFRVLAELSHPNLVTLYELLGDDEGCAFTMELVPGEDFLSHTRPQGVLDLPRLRGALRGLAEGLDALHTAGVVHRDLKPSNVLVTPEGRVVLLDFGVAFEGAERDVAGTAAFMAREQRFGATVPASDLYAAGTMLALALTGTFEPGGDESSELAPWLELSRKLRHEQPEERPTARELVAFLDGEAAPARAQPARRTFVGREAELAVLRRHVTTRGTEAQLVVVEGTSGLGKSWLLAELTRECTERPEVLLLSGRCSRREAVRYRALDPLLDALSTLWKSLGTGGEALVPEGARALTELFPVLSRIPALAARARSDSPIADARERRRVAISALRDVLARLCERRRVVLCVDDSHWMDDDSLELLSDLVRPPVAPPLLILALTRPSESAAPLPLEALVKQMARTEKLVLTPLDHETALSLVQVLLPERPALWERALELGEGSPFLLSQLGALASDTGALGASLGLEPILKARLDKLGPLPRRVLELVAVAGQPVAAELLREVLGESDVSLMGALTMLEAQRYLRSRRGEQHAFEPYHDRVTDFVHRIVQLEAKRGYHLSLGHALEARDPLRHARSLLFHFGAAGDAGRALAHGRVAAEAAIQRLAFHEAADIYGTCVELAAETREVRELKARRAEVLASAGRDREAAEVFHDLSQGAPDALSRDELTRRSAELLLRGGLAEDGLKRLEPLLARLGMTPPKSTFLRWLGVALRRLYILLRGDLRYTLRPAHELDPRALSRLDVCLTIARYLGPRSVLWGIDFGTRALLYALRSGERTRLTRALLVEAVVRSVQRDPGASERCLSEARKLAEEVGDEEALAHVHFAAAQSGLVRLDNQKMVTHTEEALRRLTERCTGVASDLAMVRYMRLLGRHARGETALLRREVAEGLREAAERRDARAENTFRDVGISVELVTGNVDKALEEVERLYRERQMVDFDMGQFGLLLFRCQVDLYQGHSAEARTRLEAMLPTAAKHGMMHVPVTRVLILYMHALILMHFRDRRATRRLDEIVRLLARDGESGRAFATQMAAGIAVRSGRREEAVRSLEQVSTELEQLGCTWQSQASRVLSAQLRGDERAVEAVCQELRERGVAEPLRYLSGFAPFGAREAA